MHYIFSRLLKQFGKRIPVQEIWKYETHGQLISDQNQRQLFTTDRSLYQPIIIVRVLNESKYSTKHIR